MTERESINVRLRIISAVIGMIGASLLDSGYIQTFMISLGASLGAIGIYYAIIPISSITVHLLLSFVNPVRRGFYSHYVLSLYLAVITPIGLLISCFVVPYWDKAYLILFSTGVLANLFACYTNMCYLCIIPFFFPRNEYAMTSAKSGIFGGFFAVLITLTIGVLFTNNHGNISSYLSMFILSSILCIISANIASKMKLGEIDYTDLEKKPVVSIKHSIDKLLSNKYQKLLLPHFIRGMASAGLCFIVPIALFKISLAPSETVFVATAGITANIIGYYIFMKMIKIRKSGYLMLLGTIFCANLAMSIVFCENKFLFLILYLLYMSANVITQISVPYGLVCSTLPEDMPFMSNLRTVAGSVPTSILSILIGSILTYKTSFFIILVAGCLFIICGYIFFKQYKDILK